jgi:hypothetical protein
LNSAHVFRVVVVQFMQRDFVVVHFHANKVVVVP